MSVEQHQAVHLASQPDGAYALEGQTACSQVPQRPPQSVPPVGGKLLCPARLWTIERIDLHGPGNDTARSIYHYRLQTGGTDVEAKRKVVGTGASTGMYASSHSTPLM